jgi:hypothetical protein
MSAHHLGKTGISQQTILLPRIPAATRFSPDVRTADSRATVAPANFRGSDNGSAMRVIASNVFGFMRLPTFQQGYAVYVENGIRQSMTKRKYSTRVGRNDPCPCGSGLKYKKCCLPRGPDAYGTRIQTQTVPVVLDGARTEILSSMVWRGRRFRIIWNRLFGFSPEQTFHEFLDYLTLETLNPEWFRKQAALPEGERHVVVQWRKALLDLVKTPPDTSNGGWVRTGPVQAYLCFAYDLYWLQILNKLPKSLVRRLRDKEAFQGARYEVLVAACFARAGFDIELLDESVKSARHCEFVATRKKTRAQVYVEAKSRRRRGVLHEPGTFDLSADVRGDVFGLYSDAIRQAPQGHPYFIFIDANLPVQVPDTMPPYGAIPFDEVPWVKEIEEGLKARWSSTTGATVETAVLVTNFAPHFGGQEGAAPLGLFAVFPSPKPITPLIDGRVLDDLVYCLRFYGTIPKQF